MIVDREPSLQSNISRIRARESRQAITCEVIAAPHDLSDIRPVAVQNCLARYKRVIWRLSAH